jgi:hypothetical protein
VKSVKTVPLIIAVLGIILLAGGASSYIAKSSSTVVCEACGMEIPKDDVSTIAIVSDPNGDVHYGCCPVCAMEVAMYYENATLEAHCFSCDENITIRFDRQNITSASPIGGTYNVTMLFAMSCPKNKFVCSNDCANITRTTYDWAAGLPAKTVAQIHGIAASKLSQSTVGYKPMQVPAITYGLLFGGVALLIIAPLEWRYVEKKKTGGGV